MPSLCFKQRDKKFDGTVGPLADIFGHSLLSLLNGVSDIMAELVRMKRPLKCRHL
eukprot:m.92559 g.92559  ORF g.92559 m.92559 type:complete len:55 (+) comp36738_c0_seq6:744-908(+)